MKIDEANMGEEFKLIAIDLIENKVKVYIKRLKGSKALWDECKSTFLYFELYAITGVFMVTDIITKNINLYEITTSIGNEFDPISINMNYTSFDTIITEITNKDRKSYGSCPGLQYLELGSVDYEYIPITMRELEFQTFSRRVF